MSKSNSSHINPLQPTCPNCGGVLTSYVLTCIPPITEYRCHRCGFRGDSRQPKNAKSLASSDMYAKGEWDMFELITSTWYGKQCYFKEDDDIVYSRISNKYMAKDKAYLEFLQQVGDDGDY